MKQTTKVLIFSFVANLFLSLSKVIVGFLGTSQALVADGIHSFSDLATDVVAIFGNKMATRPADMEHPFGHGRVEYITSMFIAITILGLGFTLLKESILRGNQLPDIKIIALVMITIVIKILVASYLLRSGKKMKNQILISSGKESFTDVFSSCLVLLVVLLSQFQNKIPLFAYADRVGGVLIGILILFTGLCLLKENISILIGQRELDQETIDEMHEMLEQLNLTGNIKDIVLMKYGPYYRANIVIQMEENQPLKDFEENSCKVKEAIQNSFTNIQYIDVQVDIKK